jgi:hypothetical protein
MGSKRKVLANMVTSTDTTFWQPRNILPHNINVVFQPSRSTRPIMSADPNPSDQYFTQYEAARKLFDDDNYEQCIMEARNNMT